MKDIKKKTKLTMLRDCVRLFFAVNFFVVMLIFGLHLEIETEYVVLVSFFVVGPFFCGWFCPFGGASYFIYKIGNNLWPNKQFSFSEKVDKVLRFARYVFLIYFIYLFTILGVNYFGEHIDMYNSAKFSKSFLITKMFAVLIIPLFIPYFFCKYMCWQKAFYNIMNSIFCPTQIVRDEQTCMNCKKCNKVCPMNLPISRTKKIYGADCFNCFNCLDEDICPNNHKALSFMWFKRTINLKNFYISVLFIYICITIVVISFMR